MVDFILGLTNVLVKNFDKIKYLKKPVILYIWQGTIAAQY